MYVPVGQALHAAEPTPLLYEPTAHSTQLETVELLPSLLPSLLSLLLSLLLPLSLLPAALATSTPTLTSTSTRPPRRTCRRSTHRPIPRRHTAAYTHTTPAAAASRHRASRT